MVPWLGGMVPLPSLYFDRDVTQVASHAGRGKRRRRSWVGAEGDIRREELDREGGR